MSFELHDGVWEVTDTHGGTGNYPLGGKPPGEASALHAFGDVFGDGDQFYYRAWRTGEGEEEGIGEYDATNDEIVRVRPIKSTNGNAAVDWGAGGVTNLVVTLGSGILQSLVDPSGSHGIRVRRGNELYAHRTLQAGNGISIANGDGVAGDPSVAVVADTYAPYAVPSLTGGTASRVVRISAADTVVDADRTHTVAQLSILLWKTAGGLYLPPGRLITGLSSLTAGAAYYLSTSGQITNSEPDLAANPTWCKVVVGVALSTTRLWFQPRVPIRGS